jgi:uncharacterized protein (TIGR03118 family)
MVFSFLLCQRTEPVPRRYRPALECLEERQLLSGGFGLVNLASDVPGLARFTDPNLANPWGIVHSPTGPFWFADNGSGVSSILDGRGEPFSLVVAVSSAAHSGSTPTGTVFNARAGFAISENGVSAPSRFLFASNDGTIAGWSAIVDPTRAVLAVDRSSSGAVYTGLALASDPAGHTFLYAADFAHGTIDVFDPNFRPVVRLGAFQDPSLPAGFAPLNVQNINNFLFVTYAQQDEGRSDDVPGAGHGFIDVYDTTGTLVRRFASRGALNSPWGLALAPAQFGPFGGALLVGNNGDGHINAYDPASGNFLGQLADDSGSPIAISNLWALSFGNGHLGGDAGTLFFAAGVDGDAHGLFGAIQAPERRGADTAGPGAFDPHAPGEPGDYPLPPRSGPAFRDRGEDIAALTADLLPLRESSLVLVPTLATIPQPSGRIEAPVPVDPMRSVSPGRPTFTAVPVSNTIMLLPATEGSQPAQSAHNGAVALQTFLDVSASASVLPQPGVQRPGNDLNGGGAPRSPAEDFDARAEGHPLAAYVQRPESPSVTEQLGPEAPPSWGQTDEALTAVPSENRAESAEERGTHDERVEARNGGLWLNLMAIFSLVSMPTMWACWVSHQLWSCPSAQGSRYETRGARF